MNVKFIKTISKKEEGKRLQKLTITSLFASAIPEASPFTRLPAASPALHTHVFPPCRHPLASGPALVAAPAHAPAAVWHATALPLPAAAIAEAVHTLSAAKDTITAWPKDCAAAIAPTVAA